MTFGGHEAFFLRSLKRGLDSFAEARVYPLLRHLRIFRFEAVLQINIIPETVVGSTVLTVIRHFCAVGRPVFQKLDRSKSKDGLLLKGKLRMFERHFLEHVLRSIHQHVHFCRRRLIFSEQGVAVHYAFSQRKGAGAVNGGSRIGAHIFFNVPGLPPVKAMFLQPLRAADILGLEGAADRAVERIPDILIGKLLLINDPVREKGGQLPDDLFRRNGHISYFPFLSALHDPFLAI